ncbi:hypothetical protein [Streptomyces cylindrosporus]|uniref:hypothetical protein n=1 Tax=Streptomyces cylindrosporus TaxID=2927583 RepID=UPI0027E30B44|nr:hypothetical protein [Streptomyces cylindrosporus]
MTVHLTAILLAFGADPRLRDPKGNSPLDVARQYGHQLGIELLLKHVERWGGESPV